MSENVKIRLIDELGRIALPKEVRDTLDFNEKTPVEIRVNETNNEVVLKKHTFSCMYCGATEELKEYSQKHICSACRKAIAAL